MFYERDLRLAGEAAELSLATAGRPGGPVNRLQRARLLVATAEASAELGAANVTVSHIIARAGVSRRTFYELFEDREDCFLAAFDDGISRIAEEVLPAYTCASGWQERMRASLIAALEFLDHEPMICRLLVVDSLGAGASALHRRARVLARIVAAVDLGRSERKGGGESPPSVTAEGVVGGVLSVLHSRLVERSPCPLLELAGPLMSMIVLPYLGQDVATSETVRSRPQPSGRVRPGTGDPLRGLEMRLTRRTIHVLMSIASKPGASNREVGLAAGIQDQSQTSKLLARLQRLGLVQNATLVPSKGSPNAWTLTVKGREIEQAVGRQATARRVA
jgi:AcrR family transcriptional regulator